MRNPLIAWPEALIVDKIMPNTLEHEKMRFNTMSFKQLRTRLYKITDRQKILNFIQCCDECNCPSFLKDEAMRRYENLFSVMPAVPCSLGVSSFPGRSKKSVSSDFKKEIKVSLKESVKPADIADVISTKRKLRLD